MSHILKYDIVTESSEGRSLTYFFISIGLKGQEDILKVIQFAPVRFFDNKETYNFGFGDYDILTGQINDEAITDNGDTYKIFNTVLTTIPMFFEKNPEAAILVTGSDGRLDFETKCRLTCKRKCGEACRKFNRRVRLYCQYVSREYKSLIVNYHFIGGLKNKDGWYDFTEFQIGQVYDSVVVSRKNS